MKVSRITHRERSLLCCQVDELVCYVVVCEKDEETCWGEVTCEDETWARVPCAAAETKETVAPCHGAREAPETWVTRDHWACSYSVEAGEDLLVDQASCVVDLDLGWGVLETCHVG